MSYKVTLRSTESTFIDFLCHSTWPTHAFQHHHFVYCLYRLSFRFFFSCSWFDVRIIVSPIQQPIDCKRDQFRKYIESKGVIDMITKVLIKLLEAPVKPEHPMDFIRDNLGATMYERNQIEQLEQQVNDYKKEVSDLKSQIDELKSKLGDKENDDEKLSNVNVASDTAAVAEKVSETAVNALVSLAPAINGGAKIDDSADNKISESEKAVAPASVAVDDIPVIEAATAEEQSTVSTVCDNGDAANMESAPTSADVTDEPDVESTKKTDSTAGDGITKETISPSAANEEATIDAIDKADTSADAKLTASTSAADSQK